MFRPAPAETAQERAYPVHREVPQAVLNRRQLLRFGLAGLLGMTMAQQLEAEEIHKGQLKDPKKIRDWYQKNLPQYDYVAPGRREYYPYKQSALQYFIDRESEVFPKRTSQKTIMTIANNIANRAALMLRDEVRELKKKPEMGIAEALAEARYNQDLLETYAVYIGWDLAQAGDTYKEIAVFSDGMDPRNNHPDGGFHLDCDTRTFVVLHAAHRHDLPLAAVTAPRHMYVGSNKFASLAVEMTGVHAHSTSHLFQKNKHTPYALYASRLENGEDFAPLNDNTLRAGIVGSVLWKAREEKNPDSLKRAEKLADRLLTENIEQPLWAMQIAYTLYLQSLEEKMKVWEQDKNNVHAHTEAVSYLKKMRNAHDKHAFMYDIAKENKLAERLGVKEVAFY